METNVPYNHRINSIDSVYSKPIEVRGSKSLKLTSGVPRTQSRMWSQAELAAERALESFLALMIAAPRCWTVVMNSSFSLLGGKGDPSVPIYQEIETDTNILNCGIWDLPCIIRNKFTNRLLSTGSLHCGMVNIRVLTGRVVTPDDNILHITDLDIKSLRNLAKSPVVVQTGQAGNIPLRNRWSKLFQDKSIGICWVGNNQNLQSTDQGIANQQVETAKKIMKQTWLLQKPST